jgi:dienelactone hydrolase
MTLACTVLALAVRCAPPAAAADMPLAAVEPVAIPPAGLSTSPAPLTAFVFQPRRADGGTPGPAVVMLHGCGGAYARDGSLNARHHLWGEFLAAHGYLALMLDSFTSRGLRELCTLKLGTRPLTEAGRVGDAYAALAWLRTRPDVDPARILLLGWSHGGGVTLDAIVNRPPAMTGFRAAVAFYPGCSARNRHAGRFHPYAPLLVLIGEADDWTPAAPCLALAAAAAARGEPAQIVSYPATYHDFDNPAITKQRVRRDVPNGVHPGAGVTTAPNAAAREDAQARVLKFFAENGG